MSLHNERQTHHTYEASGNKVVQAAQGHVENEPVNEKKKKVILLTNFSIHVLDCHWHSHVENASVNVKKRKN